MTSNVKLFNEDEQEGGPIGQRKVPPFSTLSHNPWHAGRFERWLLRNRFASHKSRSIFAAIGTERVIYTILFMFKADGQHMIARDSVVGPLSRLKDEEFGD